MMPGRIQTLGVGIIGFGFMGKVHAYDYQSLPFYYDPVPIRTKLVGVGERTPDRVEIAVAKAGFEFGTTNWRDLIARDDIHIIDICSPNNLHADQLLAAMAAGKHIYCDKPLVSGEEAMARVAGPLRSFRGVGQVALQYRFYPATLRAKQLLEEGFVGNVVSFRAAYLHSGSIDPMKPLGWKQLKSEAGGVLQDMAPHIVDMMDYMVGPLASIYAQTKVLYPQRPNAQGEMVPVEAEDLAVMLTKLRNGTVGVIETSKIATGAEDELRFEIHGDKGALRFNSMDPNYLDAYDLREAETPLGGQRGWQRIACVQRYDKPAGFPGPKFSIGWIRAHLHSLYTFLQAIATGKPTRPSLLDGLHLQYLLAGAEKSASTQTWQTLPDRTAVS
jgi:predicted dehydrogenase